MPSPYPPRPRNGNGNAEPQLGSPGNAEPQLGPCARTDPSAPPTGWHSRGYLPHFDQPHTLQSITFRLADSLPQAKLAALEDELRAVAPEKVEATRRQRIESWLDAGLGCCALGHPAVAGVMQETLKRFDGERYHLIAWCIMPNHVHVLVQTIGALSRIVQSWKSFTARWAMNQNETLRLHIDGPAFWMRDYWDRYIRDENHYNAVVRYIEHNPVVAGLCREPCDWVWSSAGHRALFTGAPLADGVENRPA